MNWKVLFLGVGCLCFFSVAPLEAAEGEGTHSGGTETTSSEGESSKSLCALPQEALYAKLEEVIGEGSNVSINCLTFDGSAQLKYAVVSAFSQETNGTRYDIECRGGFIFATPSSEPAEMADIRERNITGCLSCDNVAIGGEICVGSCASMCERCSMQADNCTRCVACVSPSEEVCERASPVSNCMTECGENQEPNANLYNICECQPGYYKLYDRYVPAPGGNNPSLEDQEELKECGPEDEVEEPMPFTCTMDCTNNGLLANFQPNSDSNVCFACGLEDCFACDDSNHCIRCLTERILFEEECFRCPERETAFLALEQEEEEREEEEEKARVSRNLAIALPIVCVAVILFFVLTSVFAHFRYPHISHKGHKRHRKPAAAEPTSEPDENEDDDRRNLESSAQVWRARPTIRLR